MSPAQGTPGKIRSRGYWRVVVRPTTYREHHVENILELPRILERAKVSLRGWDFPHIDHRVDPKIGQSWVEQATDWEMYVEYWRFYQSGQFLHLDGFKEDWVDQTKMLGAVGNWAPGTRFSAVSNLCRFTEIFEFASRLALTPAGDKAMTVEIELHGLAGRQLWLDAPNLPPFFHNYTANIPKFAYRADFRAEDLAAKARELAIGPAQELFRRFGWDATTEIIRDLQARLYR